MVCSGAVQCNVLTHARAGVCVGSYPRLAFHMRKKEASHCKARVLAKGCMVARVHGVQCVSSTCVRTVVVGGGGGGGAATGTTWTGHTTGGHMSESASCDWVAVPYLGNECM